MKNFLIAVAVVLSPASVLAQADLTQGNDGTFSYGYSFDLPGARGRYQPHLGLSYDSGGASSVYGVGWSLNLSYIERSSRASWGTNGARRTEWWLTLDGAARLLVADPQNAGGYRPDVDSGYTELHQNGDSSWSMVDGAGNTYSFQLLPGHTTNAYYYQRYYLQQVVDVDGNTTQYSYTMEPSSDDAHASSALLASISYNNIPGSSSSWASTVQLSYAANPNPQTEVIGSVLTQHTSLLTSVSTQYAGNLLKGYQLVYSQSTQTGRALLKTIQRFGLDFGDGGQPIDQGYAFTYSAEMDGGTSAPWYTIQSVASGGSLGANEALAQATCNSLLVPNVACHVADVAALVDVNADGRPDMVWSTDGGMWWAKNISTPGSVDFAATALIPPGVPTDGGAADTVWPGLISSSNPAGAQPTQTATSMQTLFIDLNGDGLPDQIETNSPNCSGVTQIEVRYNMGEVSGAMTFGAHICTDLCNGADPLFCGPMDGWMAATGTYTDSEPTEHIGLSYQALVELADLNGDGIPDYIVSSPGSPEPYWEVFPGYIDSQGHWTLSASLEAITMPSNVLGRNGTAAIPFQTTDNYGNVFQDTTDLNGDGFPDVTSNTSAGSSYTWQVRVRRTERILTSHIRGAAIRCPEPGLDASNRLHLA